MVKFIMQVRNSVSIAVQEGNMYDVGMNGFPLLHFLLSFYFCQKNGF